MKMRKEDFEGTGKVFRFTLLQHIKNKSNIISLIIFVVFALVSVPILSIFSGSGGMIGEYEGFADTCTVGEVLVRDQSGTGAGEGDLFADPYLSSTRFRFTRDADAEAADALILDVREDGEGLVVEPVNGEDFERFDAEYCAQAVSDALYRAMLRGAGVTAQQLAQSDMAVEVEVEEAGRYTDAEEIGFGTKFGVQYVFSIFVLIISVMSVSYIIRAIVEEKASKLVELLMVSVRPLALVLGKILAVMVYVFGTFFLMILAFLLSSAITSLFLHTGGMGSLVTAFGVNGSSLNIGPMTVVIVLVSLLLGYMTFSILSGISGTCCSAMEDIEAGQLVVVLIIMAGYLVSCAAAAFTSTAASVVVSLLPIVCVFCAPVCYVCGGIGLPVLCLSWVLQALTIAALAMFCARIYNELLIRRGSRVKLRELLAMAKTAKEGE